MPVKVAIVGSGPSGFYTAAALMERSDDVEIDIIDRLPTPFGLIRGGVAPDHQTTKKVSRAYEKTALSGPVRFWGNVEIGRDLSLDELRAMYDAVVLAIGSPRDRPLGIPGDDRQGVYGSADFVGWYNGHPDFTDLAPDLNTKNVVVVGNGNVAIDIARVLVKTDAEMADTDIADHAARAIRAAPLTDVYMIGRRGPVEAKFTNVELREMGKLEEAAAIVDPAQLPATVEGDMSDRDKRLKERNLATLREFTAQDPAGKPKRVHFAFYTRPVEVLGGARVEGLRCERTTVDAAGRSAGTGEFFDIPCGLLVAAIGYRADPIDGVPFDMAGGIVVHRDGRIAPGLYAVGWIKRGPTGVIGSNKPDGDQAAAQVLEDSPRGIRPGRAALEKLLVGRGVKWVDYGGWKRIDAAEMAAARPGAPRRKFVRVADMLSALGQTGAE